MTVNAGELAQYPIVLYVHSDVIDNPFMRQTIYKNIQFTKNENYLLELIKEEYHYLTVVPYLNGRMQNEFFNINSQVLLFPQNDFTYYVTCVYHKSSPKHELIQDFLSFAKLFY